MTTQDSSPTICAACSGAFVGRGACGLCGRDPLLDGRYRLLEVIGRGSFGTTYAAERIVDGLRVAIKELPFRTLVDLKKRDLFERETRVLRTLDHPAVPCYIDHLIAGEGRATAAYFVQTLFHGQTLAASLSEHRYTELEVLEVLEGLLSILKYLHSLSPPIIHRDIKPQNIILRPDDGKTSLAARLALVDFGSVGDSLRDPQLGGSTIAGTFGYMAPEQFRGVATPASDIYAVGVVAVSLLSRRGPEELVDPNGRLRFDRAIVVRPATMRVLRRMLATDPSARASDAAELIRDIARARDEKAEATPRMGRAAAVIVSLALGGAATWLHARATIERPPSRLARHLTDDAPREALTVDVLRRVFETLVAPMHDCRAPAEGPSTILRFLVAARSNGQRIMDTTHPDLPRFFTLANRVLISNLKCFMTQDRGSFPVIDLPAPTESEGGFLVGEIGLTVSESGSLLLDGARLNRVRLMIEIESVPPGASRPEFEAVIEAQRWAIERSLGQLVVLRQDGDDTRYRLELNVAPDGRLTPRAYPPRSETSAADARLHQLEKLPPLDTRLLEPTLTGIGPLVTYNLNDVYFPKSDGGSLMLIFHFE